MERKFIKCGYGDKMYAVDHKYFTKYFSYFLTKSLWKETLKLRVLIVELEISGLVSTNYLNDFLTKLYLARKSYRSMNCHLMNLKSLQMQLRYMICCSFQCHRQTGFFLKIYPKNNICVNDTNINQKNWNSRVEFFLNKMNQR